MRRGIYVTTEHRGHQDSIQACFNKQWHGSGLISYARVLLLLTVCLSVASAQGPTNPTRPGDLSTGKSKNIPRKSGPTTTVIEFELLETDAGGGIAAQNWLKTLEALDVSLRIHRPVAGEKPELKEREAGYTRYVTVIGMLDRSGNILLPNKTFSPNEPAKLKEWIEELKTYGVKGSPKGQPLWGMTEEQFAVLFDALLTIVDFETQDLPFSEAVAKLPLPKQFPLRWSVDSNELLAKRSPASKARQELKGFSTGLALAVILSEQGLGFHPNRTPAGTIELVIEPLNAKLNQWPIGWPVQKATFKAAPKFYALVPIELEDVDLASAIEAISEISETPILVDYGELDTKQIDLGKIKVSQPRKMTSWSLALRQIVIPKRMTRELWQDEAGRVFVWITTTRAGRAKEEK